MVDPETLADAAPAAKVTNLLLVDDEPSVLSALRRLFRMNGYAIEQATSGADALALMREKTFDLVISDMRMPVMDGAAFLEIVRNRHPGTGRILLTGYADIGATVAAINRGEIHRYIAKPWNDADLVLVVSELLNRRELELQNIGLQALTRQQNQALQSLNDDLQALNQTLEARVAERTTELAQTNGRLEEALDDVKAQFTMAVTVLSGLLEMREGGIAGHARRVGDLALRMAVRLGLDERAQHDVHLAALLHDIGKIGFDDAMLGKSVSSYSAAEVSRYHRHPLDGEAALMPLDKLRGVALIVRQHHERLDGRGFPDGLQGAAIVIGARIVAVASDYDGLTSGNLAERVYTGELARTAILDGRGTHYDPKAVTALFESLAAIEAEALAEVTMTVEELRPRMMLARDLLSAQGAILLPKGHKFTNEVIRKVTEFVGRADIRLEFHILCKSIEPLPAAAPAAKQKQVH